MKDSNNFISLGFDWFASPEESETGMLYYLTNDTEYICSEYEPFENISVFERFGKDNSWEYYSIVSRKDKYGAINKNGKICVPLDYDIKTLELILCALPGVTTSNNEIRDGLYCLTITLEEDRTSHSLRGVTDFIGFVIVPVKFSWIHPLSSSILMVSKTGYDEKTGIEHKVHGVIDIWGNEIIPFSAQLKEICVNNGFIIIYDKTLSIYDIAGTLINEINLDVNCYTKYVKVIYGRFIAIPYNIYGGKREYTLYNFDGNQVIVDHDGLHNYSQIDEYEQGIIKMKYYDGSIHLLTPSMQLIRTRYHKIGEFKNGYAIVEGSGSEMGLIDKNFNETIELGEHSIERVSPDLCRITFRGDWSSTHHITCQGEMLLSENYQYGDKLPAGLLSCLDFDNEICIVRKGEKFGLINTSGLVVLPIEYDRMYRLPNGLYEVSKVLWEESSNGDGYVPNEYYGLVSKEGKPLTQLKYKKISQFDDSNCAIVSVNNKNTNLFDINNRSRIFYGIINSDGKEILPPIYETIRKKQDNGMSVIKGEFGFGIFNYNNLTFQILPKYDYVSSFQDGLCAVNIGGQKNERNAIKGGLWGYINEQYELVIPLMPYDSVGKFNDNYTKVYKNKKVGLIDRSGNLIIPCECNNISIDKGSIICTLGGTDFRMSNEGEILESFPHEEYSDYDDYSGGYTSAELDDMYRSAFEGNSDYESNID